MKRVLNRTFVIAAFVAVWGWALSIDALVAIEKDFSQLVSEANLILVGTVIDLEGKRLSNGSITTHITFNDLNVVKGQIAYSTYTLEILGGTVGREHFDIPGAPTFTQDETYVLFIKGNSSSMFPLVGAHQGQFQVRYDHVSKMDVLFNTHNHVITGIDSDNAIVTENSATSHALGSQYPPYTLPMFLDDITKQLPR
ncbi:MAG TPA: hypothetical protein EYG58_07080 [Nitrospirales bacterium]|nr:hypothetical protein [Nitrospirales bacterium]HIC05134.1 hypothetical protein [Nitrospirales bacterium]HIO70294.1 hypothetical protein [Nitrospirales bacterium]